MALLITAFYVKNVNTMGIYLNNLISSYLINRKQCVSINSYDPELRDLVYGVPQGSSVFDIVWGLFKHNLSVNFADDTFTIEQL